jgi:hypothetical protein
VETLALTLEIAVTQSKECRVLKGHQQRSNSHQRKIPPLKKNMLEKVSF